jgi:hypothetical protein
MPWAKVLEGKPTPVGLNKTAMKIESSQKMVQQDHQPLPYL